MKLKDYQIQALQYIGAIIICLAIIAMFMSMRSITLVILASFLSVPFFTDLHYILTYKTIIQPDKL